MYKVDAIHIKSPLGPRLSPFAEEFIDVKKRREFIFLKLVTRIYWKYKEEDKLFLWVLFFAPPPLSLVFVNVVQMSVFL